MTDCLPDILGALSQVVREYISWGVGTVRKAASTSQGSEQSFSAARDNKECRGRTSQKHWFKGPADGFTPWAGFPASCPFFLHKFYVRSCYTKLLFWAL
jgi:hypothetical protein